MRCMSSVKSPRFPHSCFCSMANILFFLRSYSSFFCRPMEIIPFTIFVRSLQRHNEPFIIIISHCALYDWVKFICYSVQMDWLQTLFFFIYPNRNLFHGYESNTYINKHGINIIGKSVALKWSQIWPKVVSCWRKMGKSRQRKNCCWIFHLIKLTWISAGIWTDLLNGRQTLTWYT